MERGQEDIVMLNDILDYLNNHEARTLLELSRPSSKRSKQFYKRSGNEAPSLIIASS
jgi:hypothetical protein